MSSSRRELHHVISQDIIMYNETKPQMSVAFLGFLEEYIPLFLQAGEFQYIMVPLSCHTEFRLYLDNPEEKIIYQDTHHCHYIDPVMKPMFYQFCQTLQILPMCRKIQSYPSTRRLPVSLMIEEATRHQIPERYYRLLIDCVEPSGLSFLLPLATYEKALGIARRMMGSSQRFPLFIGNTFITNWLILQGCDKEMLDQMWNNGFPLKFPLCIETAPQKLCPIQEDIVGWCFQKCQSDYPFSTNVDHIIMNPTYQDDLHFPLVSYSIRHGHTPSDTAFSILLKKTDLSTKDVVFKDYIIQQLKTDHFQVLAWAETSWQANQEETIELILTFCKPGVQSYVIIHLCINTVDILHVDMDYWVLKLWGQYSSLMNFVHLVRFYRDHHVRMVDPRILRFVRHPPNNPVPLSYPPFHKRHPQMIVFDDNHGKRIEIPVYLSYLRSGLFLRLSSDTGFRPLADKDIIQLETGLPDIFIDQEKVMCDWVMYSYFRHIPYDCSVSDVIELYHLSQYLVDEDCETAAEEWLDHQYMTHYETHMRHDDKKQECLLCSFWHR